MVLGAIACSTAAVREVAESVRSLKVQHDLSSRYEAKWTKISASKLAFYLDLINLFFADDRLSARVLIARKDGLNHEAFMQTHDDFYFKMYYQLLLRWVEGGTPTRVYIDIKDTRSIRKVRKLESYLRLKLRDDGRLVQHIQQVRSHEVQLLQLVDVLIGALNFKLRASGDSAAKHAVVDRIEMSSKYPLDRSTPRSESKLNFFHWQAQ